MPWLMIVLSGAFVSQADDSPGVERVGKQSSGDRRAALEEIVTALERLADKPYLDRREEKEFERLVDRGAERYLDEPEMLYWVGDLFERRGKASEASAVWRKALESPSKAPNAVAGRVRARCAQRLGYRSLEDLDDAEASRLAEQSLRWAPDDIRGYRLLFDTSLRTGRIFEVIPKLRTASDRFGARDPDFISLYFDVLASVGDWETLRSDLSERLALAPNSTDSSHFQALLAHAAGKRLEAFAYHFLAMHDGPLDRPTTRRSAWFVERQVQTNDRETAGPLRLLVEAYAKCDRPESSDEALDLLEELRRGAASTSAQQSVAEHVRATALATSRRFDEALAVWRGLLERLPNYSAALCGAGELLELSGKFERADRLFDHAIRVAPKSRRVRGFFRLGARFQVVDEGIAIRSIDQEGPLAELGLRAGDLIVRLDGEPLREPNPLVRMRTLRHCRSGEFTYRDRNGKMTVVELEPLLDPR